MDPVLLACLSSACNACNACNASQCCRVTSACLIDPGLSCSKSQTDTPSWLPRSAQKTPKRVAHTGCCFGSLLGPLPETASIFDQKLELALHRPISRPIPDSLIIKIFSTRSISPPHNRFIDDTTKYHCPRASLALPPRWPASLANGASPLDDPGQKSRCASNRPDLPRPATAPNHHTETREKKKTTCHRDGSALRAPPPATGTVTPCRLDFCSFLFPFSPISFSLSFSSPTWRDSLLVGVADN